MASSETDCRSSHYCWNYGRCALEAGRCVASSQADCRASWACGVWGHCTARAGLCVVGSDADCRSSTECRTTGACALRGERCSAGSDADCAQAEVCAREGRCRRSAEGPCVTPAELEPLPEGGPPLDVFEPLPGDEASYRERWGHHGPCPGWDYGCVFEGRCTLLGERCAVVTDADCQQSEACLLEERCVARDGSCVVGPAPTDEDCAARNACSARGWCWAKGRQCVPAADADCERSTECRELGRCRVRMAGTALALCVAGADADCAGSSACRLKGRCLAHPDGYCAEPKERGSAAGARPVFVPAAQLPARGFRSHHCDEPLLARPAPPEPLRAAQGVSVRRIGATIALDPLGLRILVPNAVACPEGSSSKVLTDPASFTRAPPSDVLVRASKPLGAWLYGSLMPFRAQLFELEVETNVTCAPGKEPDPVGGLTVRYFSVQEPVAEVLARFEALLVGAAQTQGCNRRGQRARQRDRHDWGESPWLDGAWGQWRDDWGPWRRFGVAARWEGAGNRSLSWLDVRAERLADRTLVVVVEMTGVIGDAPTGGAWLTPEQSLPELLLPTAGPTTEGTSPPSDESGSRCPLSPVDDIHYALRSN
jgi:hypothetical protein